MRSGATMKVSLTPDRLKSMEVRPDRCPALIGGAAAHPHRDGRLSRTRAGLQAGAF